MQSPDTYGVLFVCLGNICRSPLAEGVFRQRLERHGLGRRVRADSAGMQGYHEGDPPDPRAVRAASLRGYDIAGQRARRVRRSDFEAFDMILGLDLSHVEGLKGLAPIGARAQVSLLLDHAPHLRVREVPDPYYGGPEDFDHALSLIEAGIDGLMPGIAAAVTK